MIATKARAPMGPGPNDMGLSRKHLMDAVDASLKRLQTDYIDLYQVSLPFILHVHADQFCHPLWSLSTDKRRIALKKVNNWMGWLPYMFSIRSCVKVFNQEGCLDLFIFYLISFFFSLEVGKHSDCTTCLVD